VIETKSWRFKTIKLNSRKPRSITRLIISISRVLAQFAAVLMLAQASQTQTAIDERVGGGRNALKFPGQSIVEQIQAAIRDCGSNPCEVYIPAGSYNSSPIRTWNARDTTGSSVGVAIPSNVEIRGAGQGRTMIKVTRSAGDPSATLFANSGHATHNIRLHDMTVSWSDSATTYNWVSIFICHACTNLELDHLTLEGNPNKLANLLDCTGSSVHDNDFQLRSTGYGQGDNALGVSRFEPSASVTRAAGVVRDNQFVEVGDYRGFSMLVVSQSGLYVHSNVFEANIASLGHETGIESGQDNLGRIPEHVKISDNIFHGTSVAHGGLNDSEISNNFFSHGDIYVALQSGSTASITDMTIADNELHFGDISIGSLQYTFSGRFVITRNRVFDGSIRTGGALNIHDIEVTYNSVRDSSNENGIDCNACSLIKGNIVREVGQNAPGDVHAGYLIGGTVADVSDNVYLDEQHDYDGGTICSVEKPSSTACLSSGTSRWIRLQGGEWGFGWSNRTLYADLHNSDGHSLLIRAFMSNSLLELDDNAPVLPAGTHYHLYRTTFNAFELNSATIERFANNLAISAGGFRRAAIQENGAVRIHNLSGNVFRPYNCYGKCPTDYRSTTSAPE
jgi:hypothetical protein